MPVPPPHLPILLTLLFSAVRDWTVRDSLPLSDVALAPCDLTCNFPPPNKPLCDEQRNTTPQHNPPTATMSDSDSSGLSSAPEEEVKKLAPIFQRAKKATKKAAPPPKASPPRPKRAPSPPHEDTFADNPDIAVRLRPYKTRNGALVTRVSRSN